MTIRRHTPLAAAASLLFALALAVLPGSGLRAQDAALYTVEVPLQSSAPDARTAAYRQALEEVLIRVTGSAAVAQSADVQGLFPEPGRYVLRFRPGADQSLFVTMDGEAIEALLRQAGHPVWGGDRPLTLVWLAVDWGQGERELVGADEAGPLPGVTDPEGRNAALRDRLAAAALRRGVPILLPLLDTEDLEQVSFSDVWGGFDQTLADASRRYGTASILVGRIRDGDATRGRWSYQSPTQRLEWSGTPEDVVTELAEAFAAEYAYAGSAAVQSVALTVSGVDSVTGYGRVQQMLTDLSIVESFRLDTVSGGDLSFRVEVRGGGQRLAQALEFSGVLRRADWLGPQDFSAPSNRGNALGYLYQPDVDDARGEREAGEAQDYRSASGPN